MKLTIKQLIPLLLLLCCIAATFESCLSNLEDIRAISVPETDIDMIQRIAPEGTIAILSANLDPLFRDEKVGVLLFKTTHELFDSSKVMESLQDIVMIHNLTVFYQKRDAPTLENMTFLVTLSMNIDSLKDKFSSTFSTSVHRNRTLYVSKSPYLGTRSLYLCFLEKQTIIAGSLENITHILDVTDRAVPPAAMNPKLPALLPVDRTTIAWATIVIGDTDTVPFVKTRQSPETKPKDELHATGITGARIIADIMETSIDIRLDMIIEDPQEKELIRARTDKSLSESLGKLSPDVSEIISGYTMHDQPWGLAFGVSLDKVRIIDKIEKSLKDSDTLNPDLLLKGIL